jgi:hypothetical protein
MISECCRGPHTRLGGPRVGHALCRATRYTSPLSGVVQCSICLILVLGAGLCVSHGIVAVKLASDVRTTVLVSTPYLHRVGTIPICWHWALLIKPLSLHKKSEAVIQFANANRCFWLFCDCGLCGQVIAFLCITLYGVIWMRLYRI